MSPGRRRERRCCASTNIPSWTLDRVGYLGPEGSFSHEAVSTHGVASSPSACRSIEDLLGAVADAELDQGARAHRKRARGNGVGDDRRPRLRPRPGHPSRDRPADPSAPARASGRRARRREDRAQLRPRARPVRAFVHERGLETVQTTSTSQAARDVAESSEPWAAVGSVARRRALRSRRWWRPTSKTTPTTRRASCCRTRRRRGAHGTRPHDDRLLSRRRPPRLALRDSRSFRRARHQPDEAREPSDQAGARRLLLRHRVRRSRRRRRRRRLPRRPTGAPRAGEVPRLLSGHRCRGATDRREEVAEARRAGRPVDRDQFAREYPS